MFDHALSFTMIRGGHLTHAVIGAIEVAANGDLGQLACARSKSARRRRRDGHWLGIDNLYVAMTHVTNKGKPKILTACTCPLTAPRCVRRIYTDMAVIDVTPVGLVLREVAPGLDPAAVQARRAQPRAAAANVARWTAVAWRWTCRCHLQPSWSSCVARFRS